MDNVQGLYYAFGQLAYALAASDGAVQTEEKKALHVLLSRKTKGHDLDFDYAEIIFHILDKDHINVRTAYTWAIKEMKLNEYYLTERRKKDFIDILEKIAEVHQPVTLEEKNIIDKFKEEISQLHADPVFTGEK